MPETCQPQSEIRNPQSEIPYYFCTYFDSNYLLKGLTLYRSLIRHAIPFRLWVLCFDDLAYKILHKLALPEVTPLLLRDFEEGDEELLQAKGNRSQIEYYFTCTPSLPLYILKNHPEVDIITYLDADLFFFSAPSPVYKEIDKGSVLIVRHCFPPLLKHLEVYGIYNVGLISFRKDDAGLQCLHWWRSRCLEWCHDRVEDGRFADQKYLDDWPTRFQGVVVIQHKGTGLAPWNVENYFLRLENGQVLVDSQPLVFFHFQGVKQMRRWLYNPDLAGYGVHTDSLLKQCIYGPYIRELRETTCWVSRVIARSNIPMGSIRNISPREPVRGGILHAIVREIKHRFPISRKILRDDLWVVIAGRIV